MTLGHRPLLPPALVAAVGTGLAFLVLAALLVTGSVAPSSAAPLGPGANADEPDDVFSASIERIERDPGLAGRPVRYTYTVQVQEVFGPSDIASVRVRVQTTSAFNECATRPDSRGDNLFLWRLNRQGTAIVADGCRDVLRATDLRLTDAAELYGEPRSPIDQEPAEPQVEFPDVSYLCPETSEALADVASAVRSCDEVADDLSFDRAAAPGLALVIVGVLGWIVVLRLGRTRRS